MNIIKFVPGPQVKGTIVEDSNGVLWEVLKDISSAKAEPREGVYYTKVIGPTPMELLEGRVAKLELKIARIEGDLIPPKEPESTTTTSTTQAPVSSTTTTTTKAPTQTGQVEMDIRRSYQVNNFDHNADYLFDNKLESDQNPNWGQVLKVNKIVYEFKGEATINKIVLRDGQGSDTVDPCIISGITKDWEVIPLITFTGDQWQADVEYLFDNIKIKYLTVEHKGIKPDELDVYGTESGEVVNDLEKPKIYLTDQLAVNAFEWEFLQDPANPGDPTKIVEHRMDVINCFTGIRHYADWEKLEDSPGSYTFNPTYSGGWNYDAIYERCKQDGIFVLFDMKECAKYIRDSYPEGERNNINVPMMFGLDKKLPQSYIHQAKAIYQYCARYGSVKVDPSLLSVNSTPRWNGDIVNEIKSGLNLITHVECDNERDKWWGGNYVYQTGDEYAANLSAFYDGHKNTMGPGVGVKNADPNMKVVVGGTASSRPDYFRAIVDWAKKNRGYLPDGTIDVPFDVINIHDYSNNGGKSQGGQPTRGCAPELGNAAKNIDDLHHMIKTFIGRPIEIWNTEVGYDINQGSIQKAIPIGDKTAEQTQSDWLIRTALLHARKGVTRTFAYMLNDDNFNNPQRFASSGLANRKVMHDYKALKELADGYYYAGSMSDYPVIDVYKNDENEYLYIVYVPDEVGKEIVCTFIKKDGSSVTVTATETPQYFK